MAGSTMTRSPRVERGVSSVDHFADHFVAHDQRVADGDRAFVDVQIGPADAAMGHSDEDLVVSESGPLDFRKAQIAGPSQDHGFHESCFRQMTAFLIVEFSQWCGV